MTEKEKAIYNEFYDKAYNYYENGRMLYKNALAMPCLKRYTYEDRKKILEGMRKRGLLEFFTNGGYIAGIEVKQIEK